MVGSAVLRALESIGARQVLTRTRSELDLTDQHATRQFFLRERPQCVVFAAARVGGILANSTYPAEFIYHLLLQLKLFLHEQIRIIHVTEMKVN